jgi:hypothetical protein
MFLGTQSGIQKWCFSLCCWGAYPELLGEVILPSANRQFDPEKGLILPESQSEDLRCTTEPEEMQEPARGVLTIRLLRTQVQILGLPLSGRRGA